MTETMESLPRALLHQPAGAWPVGKAVDSVTLDFDARHRRRIRLTSDRQKVLLLDLAKAVPMAEGDGLQLEDGSWVAVHAAGEPLLEITCDNPLELVRIAWHLGNRHLPAEIRGGTIRIRPDHVIEAMLGGLGAKTETIVAPFQPEGGAYHGHGHHHDP